jgi:hypothetical protein
MVRVGGIVPAICFLVANFAASVAFACELLVTTFPFAALKLPLELGLSSNQG